MSRTEVRVIHPEIRRELGYLRQRELLAEAAHAARLREASLRQAPTIDLWQRLSRWSQVARPQTPPLPFPAGIVRLCRPAAGMASGSEGLAISHAGEGLVLVRFWDGGPLRVPLTAIQPEPAKRPSLRQLSQRLRRAQPQPEHASLEPA